MKYLFYAIVFDVAGNTTAAGTSTSPAKTITTNIQNVTGISINPNGAQTNNIGDTFKITATVSPSDANNKGINWSSSNSDIATVDNSGNVRCVSAGTTTITATASDGNGAKAELSLTVRNPINSLTLDKDQTTILKDGYTSTITATTDPSNYDANNISWTISDTSIATVSVSGKTATIKSTSKVGQTTLTVSAGGITKTVNVSVVNFVTTTYSYTGTVQQVDLPAGTYKLEVWGAQGGDINSTSIGGKGGYSVGYLNVPNTITLYIYIGGAGSSKRPTGQVLYCYGGWNGGGAGVSHSTNWSTSSGGGSTDICIVPSNMTLDSYGRYLRTTASYNSRIIVAGGGGGGGDISTTDTPGSTHGRGGAGGGVLGEAGIVLSGADWSGGGGTDVNAGTERYQPRAINGGFGYGGGTNSLTDDEVYNGGGGGWYGGGGCESAAGRRIRIRLYKYYIYKTSRKFVIR